MTEPAANPSPNPTETAPVKESWESTALAEQFRLQGEQIRELQESLAREREQSVLLQAERIVTTEIGRADLPEVTKRRLAESLIKAPPITDGGLDKDGYMETIREAVKSEIAYLTSVGAGGGRIQGMGSGAGFPEDEVKAGQDKLKEAFIRTGMSPEAAALAAAGRR